MKLSSNCSSPTRKTQGDPVRPCLLATALLLLASPAVRADALGDLRANLRKLESGQPVRAQIAVKRIGSSSDGDDAHQSVQEGTVLAESGPQGLRLTWTPQQIREDRQADWRKAASPSSQTERGGGLDLLDAKQAAELLDQAEPLRLAIEGAVLLEDRIEPRNGKPARVLVLRPRDELTPNERKSLRHRDDVLKIWLDAEGLPTASERTADLKFSKLLISFRVGIHQVQAFARLGGRLVVTSASEESSGSGLGQSGESRRLVRVTPSAG